MGVQVMKWFAEMMDELQRYKEEERAISRGVTTKNAILIGVTFVAVMALIVGFGVVDSTGSIVAGYPLILPSIGWLLLFCYVNRDRM